MANELNKLTKIIDDLEKQSEGIEHFTSILAKLEKMQQEIENSQKSFSSAVNDQQLQARTIERLADDIRRSLGDISSWSLSFTDVQSKLLNSLNEIRDEKFDKLESKVLQSQNILEDTFVSHSDKLKREILIEFNRTRKTSIILIALIVLSLGTIFFIGA